MKGGARVNAGRPPDPNALRRDRDREPTAKDGWVVLPASGRVGDVPAWPFVTINERESDLWVDLWSTPQAVEWERSGWLNEIALYVRIMVEAEAGIMSAATEARQWSDRLGLNPAAMLRNRWRIGTTDAPKAAVKKRTTTGSRSRLRAVPDA